MQHDRPVLGAVLGHVLRAEAFGQHEVDLQGAALPVAPDGIAQDKLQLRAVERALPRVQSVFKASGLHGGLQGRLSAVPGLVRTGPLGGPVRELHMDALEPEVRIDFAEQVAERHCLAVDLVWRAENVRVVLRERTYTHEPMQSATGLVAVARAELRHTQGQVAIALQALLVDEHVARAVHGLHRQHALFAFGDEHVLAVIIPVAGLFPQHTVHELRRLHFLVASMLELVAHVAFDGTPQMPALRVPEHATYRLFLLVEQTQLAAQTAMVALLGLFETSEVGLQFLVRAPSRAVNTLQHFVLGIAAPVGARYLHQLEGLQLRGARHVRATTQVEPSALPVQRNIFAGRNRVDDLRFVVLAHAFEQGNGFVAGNDAALHFEVRLGQFLHLGLDLLEVFRMERAFEREVVIEAVVDHGADGDLRRRVQRLHGLRQQVSRGMANDFQRFRALVRDDSQLCICGQRVAGIHELAVDHTGQRRLRQARADGRSHLSDRYGLIEAALATVGQRDDGHGKSCAERRIQRRIIAQRAGRFGWPRASARR